MEGTQKSDGTELEKRLQEQKKVQDEILLKEFQIEVKEILGKGSYSQVVKGYEIQEKRFVALKLIDISSKDAKHEYLTKFLPREKEIILMLDHPNILKTYRVIDKVPDTSIFVTEFCPKGDLLQKIKRGGVLTEDEAKPFFRQLMEAMIYLESKSVVHRDMKCENIFLDFAENVKLGDFGFARILAKDEQSNTFCGSRVYVAPEILLAKPYTGWGPDIWSTGVVLYVMVTGSMPFSDRDPESMLEKMQSHNILFPEKPELTGDVKKLILELMNPTVELRPSFKKVCESNFLKDTKYAMKTVSATTRASTATTVTVTVEDTKKSVTSGPGSKREQRKKDKKKNIIKNVSLKVIKSIKSIKKKKKDENKSTRTKKAKSA